MEGTREEEAHGARASTAAAAAAATNAAIMTPARGGEEPSVGEDRTWSQEREEETRTMERVMEMRVSGAGQQRFRNVVRSSESEKTEVANGCHVPGYAPRRW